MWVGKIFLKNKQKTDHNHFKNCLTNCCDPKLLTVGCFHTILLFFLVFFYNMIGSSKAQDVGGRVLSGPGAAGERRHFYFGLRLMTVHFPSLVKKKNFYRTNQPCAFSDFVLWGFTRDLNGCWHTWPSLEVYEIWNIWFNIHPFPGKVTHLK